MVKINFRLRMVHLFTLLTNKYWRKSAKAKEREVRMKKSKEDTGTEK